MKSLILLLICAISIQYCKAQVSLANEKMNIVYVGVENPISIAMFGYDCKDIILKADVGILTKTNCGRYAYNVSKAGIVNFKIVSTNLGAEKELSTISYRIKELPQPISDNQRNSNNYSLLELRKIKDLSSLIANFNSSSFEVIKFKYLFLRDTAIIASGVVNENSFPPKIKDEILYLLPGDSIFFENIIFIDKDGEQKKLNPIVFKLVI